MLHTHEILGVPSLNNKEIKMEVNWQPDNPETNECKVLKFIFPNGEELFIKKEHFFSLLMIIGSPEEQKKAIPISITQQRHWQSNLFIMLNKDMKRGEILKVPVNIPLPAVSEEIVGAVLKGKKVPKVDKDILPSLKIAVPESIKKVAVEHKT